MVGGTEGRGTEGRGTEGRGRRPRTAMDAYVRDAEWLSASLVRVVLEGGGLEGFAGPAFADAYVKLLFLDPAVALEVPGGPLDLEALRESLPPEAQPRMRTYTVRHWDAVRHELTIDFVVHGAAGIAGPWAAHAKPGDRVFLLGPGGAYTPDTDAGFHLFVGDLSAVPAIAVSLETLPSDARGLVLIEIDGTGDEIALEHPDGVDVRWLPLRGGPVGSVIVPAVQELPVSAYPAQAFVHGEAGFVRDLRRHLRTAWGLPADRLSASGYWRLGVDDEGWRAAKRDWVSAVAAEDPDARVIPGGGR